MIWFWAELIVLFKIEILQRLGVVACYAHNIVIGAAMLPPPSTTNMAHSQARGQILNLSRKYFPKKSTGRRFSHFKCEITVCFAKKALSVKPFFMLFLRRKGKICLGGEGSWWKNEWKDVGTLTYTYVYSYTYTHWHLQVKCCCFQELQKRLFSCTLSFSWEFNCKP